MPQIFLDDILRCRSALRLCWPLGISLDLQICFEARPGSDCDLVVCAVFEWPASFKVMIACCLGASHTQSWAVGVSLYSLRPAYLTRLQIKSGSSRHGCLPHFKHHDPVVPVQLGCVEDDVRADGEGQVLAYGKSHDGDAWQARVKQTLFVSLHTSHFPAATTGGTSMKVYRGYRGKLLLAFPGS